MAKATLTLANGTVVTIEGETDEIQKLLSSYGAKPEERTSKEIKPPLQKEQNDSSTDDGVNLSILVNTYKSSEEAEQIESNILDRSSVVDRILLPLYLAHNYLGENIALTSGEIAKFLSQLSINIFQPNIARALSTSASKYVIGDKVRKKGQAVKYRLSRRGLLYLKSVIKGNSDE